MISKQWNCWSNSWCLGIPSHKSRTFQLQHLPSKWSSADTRGKRQRLHPSSCLPAQISIVITCRRRFASLRMHVVITSPSRHPALPSLLVAADPARSMASNGTCSRVPDAHLSDSFCSMQPLPRPSSCLPAHVSTVNNKCRLAPPRSARALPCRILRTPAPWPARSMAPVIQRVLLLPAAHLPDSFCSGQPLPRPSSCLPAHVSIINTCRRRSAVLCTRVALQHHAHGCALASSRSMARVIERVLLLPSPHLPGSLYTRRSRVRPCTCHQGMPCSCRLGPCTQCYTRSR